MDFTVIPMSFYMLYYIIINDIQNYDPKNNMKLNHNWNITMVTAKILEIFLTNIVSFIQLTTKFHKQPICSLFTQIFMKYLYVPGRL